MQIIIHYTLQILAVYVLVRMLHERLSILSVIYTGSVAVQLLSKTDNETHMTGVDVVLRVVVRSVVSMLAVVVLHALTCLRQ